ncbi:MAG: polysaccharide biosynthesis protein [Proteobacteria bacterium]|jgi:FlaA1/EpsC-like NDP-sugar epimerase|nr:polysaccharide biosynthesis protein [Pseudomonadota bacterium]
MIKYLTKGTQILVDLVVLSAAFWLAFMLRFELAPDISTYKLLFFTWPYVVVFQYLLLSLFGVTQFSWRYVSLRELPRTGAALGIAAVVLVALRLGLVHVGGYAKFVVLPLGVLAMDFVLAFLGVVGVRVIRRMTAERSERAVRKREAAVEPKRTLLVGAGQAGVLVAKEVVQNPHLGIEVVGFVDDDRAKIGSVIQGHKVLGDTSSMKALAAAHDVEQAVITMATAPGPTIRKIVGLCEEIGLPVRIIPGIYEILDGKVALSRIREVTIDDLLGREAVRLDLEEIGSFLRGKRVLVTGAGGSIGSELCRQIARFEPARLALVEQAENPLFHIHRELARTHTGLAAIPCIADVADARRIGDLFASFGPEVVFHAAAHKHVPMMEWNPGEAIKNNVFGTKVVADAADGCGAGAFVMISTDKAVNPTSIMGASKRVAELYVQGLAARSKTVFVAVRFGNVLGSAGSVIPVFKEQIAAGGPVTVTHADMLRYFMTIPEACQLVMQAAAMGRGGEIFVLDMGEPVKIVDLARDLIRLSGFTEEEIPIAFTGLRPGEKLFEELATGEEHMAKTRHPKIFIGKIGSRPLAEVEAGLALLSAKADSPDPRAVRTALRSLVPEMIEPSIAPTSAATTR